jgi:hypothetical protein
MKRTILIGAALVALGGVAVACTPKQEQPPVVVVTPTPEATPEVTPEPSTSPVPSPTPEVVQTPTPTPVATPAASKAAVLPKTLPHVGGTGVQQ